MAGLASFGVRSALLCIQSSNFHKHAVKWWLQFLGALCTACELDQPLHAIQISCSGAPYSFVFFVALVIWYFGNVIAVCNLVHFLYDYLQGYSWDSTMTKWQAGFKGEGGLLVALGG